MTSEADHLYALPLDEFTAARNALAKELTERGDTDAAAATKKLRKPNLAAWATNQVARRHRDRVDELFAATDDLRRAQRRVMSGGRAPELREATDRRNGVVAELVKLAGAVLREGGHSAATQTMSAVKDSFLAVATDAEGAERLRAGCLERELHPGAVPDVGGLALVEDAPEEAAGPQEIESRPDGASLQAARAAVEEARKRAKRATKAAWEAEAEADRADLEARRLEREATAARESAEFARRAAEARRGEVTEAESALEEAEAALRRLRG